MKFELKSRFILTPFAITSIINDLLYKNLLSRNVNSITPAKFYFNFFYAGQI